MKTDNGNRLGTRKGLVGAAVLRNEATNPSNAELIDQIGTPAVNDGLKDSSSSDLS